MTDPSDAPPPDTPPSTGPDPETAAAPTDAREGTRLAASNDPPSPALFVQSPMTAAPTGPIPHDAPTPKAPLAARVKTAIVDYFLGEDPTFALAVVPLCFLSIFLFTRHPLKTNFIFDEQEALLANPYVRSIADKVPAFHWLDAFRRDFWGLPPDRSIGSYRPIPDLVWRALWGLGARAQSPFLHHWVNVLMHGVNGALVTLMAFRLTRDRKTAWLAGTFFVACAVLTEAVSGVVGIADVLGAFGALLALVTLVLPLPMMPAALFLATLFGLFSKESALVIVPLVPFAALVTANVLHPDRPRHVQRAALAALAAGGAFLVYVAVRRHYFPTTTPQELTAEANEAKPPLVRAYVALLRWFAQPALPRDPLNNPFVDASTPDRIAGALRVYFRGFWQVFIPWRLSGDYSAPQEPIPTVRIFPESVAGAALMILPILAGLLLGALSILRPRPEPPPGEERPTDLRPVVSVALLWIVVSYFPVSNIPVLLPTVRAERFWYFPAVGTSILLALVFTRLLERTARAGVPGVGAGLLVTFLGVQCLAARLHANDYTDDLSFWDATRKAVPRSAKAHLNYSVMQGARGNLEIRLESNRVALELAPTWPMASVYLGDTLCRLHRPNEAWPYYKQGFVLAPNDINLVALGIQCLWDEHMLDAECATRDELSDLSEKYPGSWLEYLTKDTLENGSKDSHKGVDPKYRPRGYNEGPKDD